MTRFDPRLHPTPTGIIGRSAERAALASFLADLQAGRSRHVLLEAEPGLGKSRLIADLLDQATSAPVPVLQGGGDLLARSTPYYAWRPIFGRIFSCDAGLDAMAAKRAAVAAMLPERLGSSGPVADLLPLLNPVLGLDFPETPVSERMSGASRADHTQQLLLQVLMSEAERQPVLLVMEDLHWLDSASMTLLRLAVQHVPALGVVLATRPLGEPQPPDFRLLKESPSVLTLKLAPLDPTETTALVRQTLGVRSLDPAIATFIRERAQGHPFLSEELAFALRDTGLLEIANDTCRLAPDAPDLQALNLPSTIDGALDRRFARLSPTEQLALKVASVMGRVFALKTHGDACREPGFAYVVRQIVTQDTAYKQLRQPQRQHLHREIADWHERTYFQDLSPYYPLLAHHWLQAGEPERAVEYLERAGEQAFQEGAYQEAVRFFDEALSLGAQRPAERRARWERQLGRAHLGLNHLLESRHHFHRALEHLGCPIPTHRPMLMARLASELLRQGLHRLWPQRPNSASGAFERERHLEAVRIYENLAELYLFTHEPLPLAFAGLRALNLAEGVKAAPQLAWAYALLSMLAGASRAAGWAEAFERMARAVPLSESDLATRAGLLLRLCAFPLLSGDWQRLEATASETLAVAERLGDRRKIAEALAVLGNGLCYRGELSRGGAMFARIRRMADRDGDGQFVCWGTSGMATMSFRQGDPAGAMQLLEAARPAFDATADGILRIIYFGHLASGYLRQGQWAKAWKSAMSAYGMAAALPVTWQLEAYFGIMEVCVAFLEAPEEALPVPRSNVRRLARKAYRLTDRAGRMFPAARPQATYWRGLYLWQQGRRRRALKALEASIIQARRLAMPYEEGLACEAMARRLPPDDPAGRAHRDRARELFARIGAQGRLAAMAAEDSPGLA